MKGSCSGEEVEVKQKYVFFSDPETISERAKKSRSILRNQEISQSRDQGQRCAIQRLTDNVTDPSAVYDPKRVESFLSRKPVQSHPFTFITAVKRKLALAAYNETSKRAYNSIIARATDPLDIEINKIDATSEESLYRTIDKMDFVKPLKVPDVKISPKTLDYSSRDNFNLRDSSGLKVSTTMTATTTTTTTTMTTTTTTGSQKIEKSATPKSTERVHRKLDFSHSEGHSFVSSDDVEPLRAPDLAISPSLAKQHKDHGRDGSREKDNRTKRMRKDDSLIVSKIDDGSQETTKRVKNPKHLSRKDIADSRRSRNERSLIHPPWEIDATGSKKPKSKYFSTPVTLRKDDERRIRSTSSVVHAAKITRDRSLESRGRNFSSESLSDRNSKLHEKVTARDQSRVGTTDSSDVSAMRYNDDYQILTALRLMDEQKQKTNVDVKPPRSSGRSLSQSIQQKPTEPREHKRITERTRIGSASKSQIRGGVVTASDITEDIDDPSDSSGNKNRNSDVVGQQSRVNKTTESNDSQEISNVASPKSNEVSSDDVILDPARISFRDDSYSRQDEFCDLVTPDLNLVGLRSKVRRNRPTNETDPDGELKTPARQKVRTSENSQNSEATFQHPTALHMQFQAELHLLDSYNESIRRFDDVEKCLYASGEANRAKELLDKQKVTNAEVKKAPSSGQPERFDTVDPRVPPINGEISRNPVDDRERETELISRKTRQETEARDLKMDVRVAEVQTQTANDIATQTETRLGRHGTLTDRAKQYSGITYERGNFVKSDVPELSMGSLEQFEDLDHIEDISLPRKMRTTMSEISLHETTSSIKTETGTEISISTRDVTCSFNKYLDHEMAQLIKDEKLMYDKIEMLFKSREKTLNDRTKKLVKLEEQKRALRDTGQDSRISSVKKKQRALLLKLQQEKDEMNRLKELHKIASQERKLMLQKQRNMFNPQMSTKNILTKLKRSADCQSPRRLSGPMKGYDIRSNSSMSSLLESEKAQIDRARMDMKILLSDGSYRFEGTTIKSDLENSAPEKLDASVGQRYASVVEASKLNDLELDDSACRDDDGRFVTPQKFESKTRKFEEKMPNSRTNYLVRQKHLLNSGQMTETRQDSKVPASRSIETATENAKSESDTLVEELSRRSKSASHENPQVFAQTRDSEIQENAQQPDGDSLISRKSKALQVTEESLLMAYKCSKKSDKIVAAEREVTKKFQHPHETKSSTSKRKGAKNLKTKSTTSNVLTENILRTRGNVVNEEIIKPASKRTRIDKETSEDRYQSSILEELDLNESQNSLQALVKHSRAVKDKNYKLLRDIACEHETKENIMSGNVMDTRSCSDMRENQSRRDENDVHNLGNISTRSQVSTFTISRHSSGESEKSFSRSVVIRAQDHRFKTSKKLEEALNAREAALVARKNCVEDWIAWHTKLKAEECRVARMEQAAFKLVSTAANALSYHDTTVSSDTSDVEGRVELLAEKLAERRVEMARLRRETRKQAKRRLKALELNLLNQIKKYDTTINEMQLKLETQKGAIRESDKLAIESRSVTDFKVPEIPLKRIQELYKNSDLLRSRSESDLIFSKSRNDVTSGSSCRTEDRENESVYKFSGDNKSNSRSSRFSSSRELGTNQSAESILEEAKKFAHQNLERNSDGSSGRESAKTRTAAIARSQEIVATEIEAPSLRVVAATLDGPSEMIDGDGKTSVSIESVGISEATKTAGTEENSKLFSRKLESLHLTNKNLNDDISTLENDLRALSEMMSQFSKKSDDKLRSGSQAPPTTDNDEIAEIFDSAAKSTSRDISEDFSRSRRSELTDNGSSVHEDLEIPISQRSNESIPEETDIAPVMEKSPYSEISNDELIAEVTEVVSIPDEESSETRLVSEEIDYEARSKEILNVIEKSIISERVKSPANESITGALSAEKITTELTHRENESISLDLNPLDGDIESISKMISEITDNEGNFRLDDVSENFADSRVNGETGVSEIDLDESPDKPDGTDNVQAEILKDPMFPNEDKSRGESSELDDSLKSRSEIVDERINELVVDRSVISEEKSLPHEDHETFTDGTAKELSQRSYSRDDDADNPTNESSSSSSSLENSARESNEEFREDGKISIGKISMENEDWTISDSFEIPDKRDDTVDEKPFEEGPGTEIVPSEISVENFTEESRESPDNVEEEEEEVEVEEDVEEEEEEDRRVSENFTCDMDDVSMFIPRGESTTIGYKFEETFIEDTIQRDSTHADELDDILDIIARESEESHRVPKIIVTTEDERLIDREHPVVADPTSDRIIPRPTDLNLTAEVEPVLQKLTEILQGVERNIAMRRQRGSASETSQESSEIPVKLTDTEEPSVSPVPTSDESVVASKISSLEIENQQKRDKDLVIYESEIILTSVDREDARDQPSDLVLEEAKPEVSRKRTDTVCEEKSPISLLIEDKSCLVRERPNESIVKLTENTFDILRDPEYEDISEESLEVSEILDRSESQRSSGGSLSRTNRIPEKYEIQQKSEDVLRILDEISQKSYTRKDETDRDQHLHDVQISVQVFGSVSPGFTSKQTLSNEELGGRLVDAKVPDDVHKSVELEIVSLKDRANRDDEQQQRPDEEEEVEEEEEEAEAEKKYPGVSRELRDDGLRKQENDGSSESSEGADTPRGVSEIEMDSPRDPNESRLDIDNLDDDLLSVGEITKQPPSDGKVEFPPTTTIVTSEKDIETMIDKLKASLEQPGLEVAELEAKLLRIEQLQIELEIKKLEAEEVSYYMREIPNKPPPPYTPPGGGGRLTTPQVSPTLPPAVVPSNVEELTAFTEKATVLIFNAKNSGLDIASLQPPPEICELSRDNNEIAKHDRRIYNTFLFDLCKETIAELYRSEYEKPGPSWTKPNVKTKPAMKIPKTVDELNDYVSKEVATLFGFKTKLQRENMVMRWSRKRRDRVDELLAREAQAEEDEWTKFHHDELAVKNELTVAILDTLILETANCVKAVYAKKRKLVVA